MLDRTRQPDQGASPGPAEAEPESALNEVPALKPQTETGEAAAPTSPAAPQALRDKEQDKAAPQPDAESKPDTKDDDGMLARLHRHPVAAGIFVVLLIAAIVGGILWYLHAMHYESTDDAFIDGRPVSISPEVVGNIVAVPVTDNQIVKAGALLAKIDDRDYVAAVEQAAAQIEQAKAAIDNADAQIKAQQAQVDQTRQQVAEAQAALNFSRDENKRYQTLVQSGYGTVQRAQQAGSDLQSKEAALAAANAAEIGAERQINVLKAQKESSEGQLRLAQAQKSTADANLSRTELHATVDGRVTRLTAAVGQVATQAQALMVLVPLNIWVTANFKETQLADMRVGQPVSIEVDAFGRTFQGHVDSVQAGSGTAFSLLPAENATGNYVKVVQRIPVKIVFDKQPDLELGPGMSVVTTVRVR